MTEHSPDVTAGLRVATVVPVWDGQVRAGEVLGERRVVVHAGPPFPGWAEVPTPIRNSLVFAVMFEGWAADRSTAAELLSSGAVAMESAQDHDIVVPLAGVCSPSMSLHRVVDRANPGAVKYAVINEGMAHMTRVGKDDDQLGVLHQWLNGPFAVQLDRISAQPLELLPLMEESLTRGDDCHAATAAGSQAVGAAVKHRCDVDEDAARFLDESPAFALNLWMAASALRLAAAEGVPGSTFVTKAAGNGYEFGIQIAAQPGRWITVRATPPRGVLEAGHENHTAAGALGDSAVVEFAGYGGMVVGAVAERAAALRNILPTGALSRAETLHSAAFGADVPQRSGLTAAAVVSSGARPYVLLGMIESTGTHGRIGGGVFEVPTAVFEEALSAAGAVTTAT